MCDCNPVAYSSPSNEVKISNRVTLFRFCGLPPLINLLRAIKALYRSSLVMFSLNTNTGDTRGEDDILELGPSSNLFADTPGEGRPSPGVSTAAHSPNIFADTRLWRYPQLRRWRYGSVTTPYRAYGASRSACTSKSYKAFVRPKAADNPCMQPTHKCHRLSRLLLEAGVCLSV